MAIKRLLLLPFFGLLLSTTCREPDPVVTEVVRLKATLSNANEVIRLADTLRLTLTLPTSLTSESGLVTPVSSVQQAYYDLIFYQLDTLSNGPVAGGVRATRITSSRALVVSEGQMSPISFGSVSVSTARTPFRSVLNIVPPVKGTYYTHHEVGCASII